MRHNTNIQLYPDKTYTVAARERWRKT